MSRGPHAFFLDTGSAPAGRFCLFDEPPHGRARGAVVHVHAFAEEMNKARRMVALQTDALVNAGYAVLRIDLAGCGDSAGDFADATWQGWIDDVVAACRWIQMRHQAPLWLWGMRAGCLVAAQAAGALTQSTNVIFWQPTVSGRSVLQQFLRLRVAGDALTSGRAARTDELKTMLANGDAVDIAGYRLSPLLAAGLERSQLSPPPGSARALWFETASQPDAQLLPATQSAVEKWAAAGHRVSARVVDGPAFWQTQEIELAPKLIEATTATLAVEAAIP